jgi:hypothetical protein
MCEQAAVAPATAKAASRRPNKRVGERIPQSPDRAQTRMRRLVRPTSQVLVNRSLSGVQVRGVRPDQIRPSLPTASRLDQRELDRAPARR